MEQELWEKVLTTDTRTVLGLAHELGATEVTLTISDPAKLADLQKALRGDYVSARYQSVDAFKHGYQTFHYLGILLHLDYKPLLK